MEFVTNPVEHYWMMLISRPDAIDILNEINNSRACRIEEHPSRESRYRSTSFRLITAWLLRNLISSASIRSLSSLLSIRT